MKELDPHTIRPCLSCGCTTAHLESMLPPGRLQKVWRVVCSCGQTSQQWSVSQGAAIRSWNRNLACAHDYDIVEPKPATAAKQNTQGSGRESDQKPNQTPAQAQNTSDTPQQ